MAEVVGDSPKGEKAKSVRVSGLVTPVAKGLKRDRTKEAEFVLKRALSTEVKKLSSLMEAKRARMAASAASTRPVHAAAELLEKLLTHQAPFAAINGLSPIERSEAVESGVPARLLSRLADELAVSKEKLYDMIGVSRATVDRKLRTDGALSAADSEHAIGMARLVGQVEQMVQESGDPEGFDAGRWVANFLDAPSPALGGRRPGELMRTSDGRMVVSTLVAQMQSGAYA